MNVARALQWAGLAGIVAVALARIVIIFALDVVFDIDPAIDSTPLGAASPVGSLALDVLLLIASAIALAGIVLDGRRLRWLVVVLVLLPAVPIIVHGITDLGDLWRGTTWLAAMIAALAVSHLAAQRTKRIVLLAVLLAGLTPLVARGAMQVSIEHQRTVEQFETHKEAFFRDRGWTADSSAARIYERRLRQPRPRGWFTTTNLLAALFACSAVAFFGVTVAAARARLPGGWVALAGLCLAVLLAGLILSGSKGAIIAAAGGLALLVAPRFVKPRWGPALCVGFVVAAWLAVLLRGAVLPEGLAGERSLLFRWHYQVAAARVVAQAPFLGVGPDGFQQAYVAHRVPRNPEEVTSTHSMPWDWLSTLGLLGAAWIGVIVIWLWQAARSPRDQDKEEDSTLWWIALKVAVVVFLVAAPMALWIELPTLDNVGATARVLGCAGFLIMAPMLARLLAMIDARVLAWSAAAAAAALVAHAQIEMTFFEPGAIVWATCFVAAASRGGDDHASNGTPARGVLVLPALIAVWAVVLAVGPLRAAALQQNQVRRAALMLDPFPADPAGQAAQRRGAIDQLMLAQQTMPSNARPAEAAVEQMLLRAPVLDPPQSTMQYEQALSLARQLLEQNERLTSLSLAIHAAVRCGDWDGAVVLARRRAELDPNGLLPWQHLGDILWAVGDIDGATVAYERALQIDQNFELDPLKQMPDSERNRIRAILNQE